MPSAITDQVAADLDRIQASVAAGDSDLKALGFWKVVGGIKRDPALVERFADQVGAVDRAAFEARVRPRFPVWFGNLVLLAGVAIGIAGIVVALGTSEPLVAGLGLLVAAGALAIATHSLAHWLVGRLVGMRFTCYFFGGPPPPRPGIKTDYGTYLRTPPRERAWMHASGAIATKLAPFVVLAFYPATVAPWWAALALFVLGVVQIATDVLFSVKSSDWKKVKRELANARRAAA